MAFMSESSEKKEPEKKDQKKQLVLLLLLIGIFGYLYFFTGLFRSEESKPETPPVGNKISEVVKQKIPGRGEESKPEAKAEPPVKTVPPKAEKPQPVKEAKPQQKPVPEAKPAAEKPVKPAPQPAPKPAETKPAPQKGEKTVKQDQKAPSAPKQPAKDAEAVKKSPQPKNTTAAAAAKKGYTILFGELPEGAVLNDLKQKLKKSGLAPVSLKPVSAAKKMHRLYVADMNDHDTALAEVAKLRKKGVDAFMGEERDKYVVYAGSYLYPDRAETERKRLKTLGIDSKIVDSETTVKLVRVSAGNFSDRESAEARLSKLGLDGFSPKIEAAK